MCVTSRIFREHLTQNVRTLLGSTLDFTSTGELPTRSGERVSRNGPFNHSYWHSKQPSLQEIIVPSSSSSAEGLLLSISFPPRRLSTQVLLYRSSDVQWTAHKKDKDSDQHCGLNVSEKYIEPPAIIAPSTGAFMFIAIEGGNETDAKMKTDKHRDELSKEMWENLGELNVFNKTAFVEL